MRGTHNIFFDNFLLLVLAIIYQVYSKLNDWVVLYYLV